jgi:hypothetical protein
MKKKKCTEKQKETESDKRNFKQNFKKLHFLFIINDCRDCFSPLFILKVTIACDIASVVPLIC